MPYIRFLFVRPRICRRLPSDSPHGGHPCLKLTIPTIKARSGLTPYSCCPCGANMSGKDHRLGGIFPCSRQFYPPYTITYYIELQFLNAVSDRKRREVHACTPFVLLLLLSVFHSFFCSPFFHFMEFYCFCSRQGIAIPSYCHAAFFRCMLQCSSTTVYVMPPPVTVVWL